MAPDHKHYSVLQRPLVSIATCLFLAASVFRFEAVAQQPKPLNVVKLAANGTRNALQSASLGGTYEVLDEAGETKVKMRVRIRFSGDKFVTEMDSIEGFRYDRVVAVADETGVCEAAFSKRIRPFGCKGDLHERRKIAEAGGIGNRPVSYHEGYTPLWLQGPLFFSHVLGSVKFDKAGIQVKKAEGGRYLGTYQMDEFTLCEFETRPEFGDNIAYLNVVDKRGGRQASFVKWKQFNGSWFIEEFEEKGWSNGKLTSHKRLKLDDVKVNLKLSGSLFSIESLGLVDGTRILDRHPNQRAIAYNYVSRKPQQGDTIRQEATRQIRN